MANPFMSMGPGMGQGMMPGTMGPSMMPGTMGQGMVPGTMGPSMMPGSMGGGMMPGGMGGGMMPGSMGGGMMPGSMGGGMMPGGMGGGMMPSSMGGGMMPGGMGGGMMPGGMMGRAGIMMEEMPNQRTLDDRRLPPMPMPWPGSPQTLMPGQATGYGTNNLHPLQQQGLGQQQRLPNAYRMYGYGAREIYWSNSVPVGEPNTGIMINAEFPLMRGMEGYEVTHWDSGIRNSTWRHQGPWIQPFDPRTDIPDFKHQTNSGFELAQDLKHPRHVKDFNEQYYKDLAKQRDNRGLLDDTRKGMTLEIMDDQELKEFWQNPEAVMADRLS